ncbi:Yip1 family protein [Streptomyces coeruleorubidus]|uniref:Yip1 family protein n=1 Tax=Streptomyces coeruleorubidus TaxID=116188 RepID=UPI0033E89CA2
MRSIRPWVVVEPPDSRGLRRVSVGGEMVGCVWSLDELRKLLERLGYPEDLDVDDAASVSWRGGDSGTWPDRAWRRRAVTVLMVAGLFASMALNAAIGWPDASGALTFAQRISGVLFVLSGVAQGVAALAALDYGGRRQFKASGAIVLLGVLIALATDSLLLFLWLEEMEFTPYVLVFMPQWFWSLWALFLLVRDKSWKGVPQPKRFAAGVVATALLTGISLAYSTMYQPAAAPMHFTLKAEFGKSRADRAHPFVQVPLTLYMKNTGGIPVYIVNDIYTVRGRVAVYSTSPDRRALVREWSERAGERGEEAERYVSRLTYTTVSSGHFYGPGKRLEIGEEYSLKRVVQLPKDAAYDTMSVDLRVSYMRKDRGKLDVDEFKTPHYMWRKDAGRFYCSVCRQVIYHGTVRHNNNLINVTRNPRYVTAIWSPVRPPISSISAFHFKGESDFRKEEKRELERYGAAEVHANAEVSLAELLMSSGV